VRANRVLTRQRGWALLVAVALAAAVPFVGSTLSGAQTEPTLTVSKVVTGPVPPGTTFTVTVVCTAVPVDGTGSAGTTASTLTPQTAAPAPVTTTLTFNANGDPTTPGSNVVPVTDLPSTCTVTETGTGGAQSVSYACASNSDGAVCGTNQQTVQYMADETSSLSATITVTNTFPPPPPPEPVVVSPTFTG
jgi:hypothetical protein